MGRPIKFRAWDNVDYMSTPFTLQDIQLKKIEFTFDAIVMQFTGLHDKNGKEIYEGDIVKSSYFIGIVEMWEYMWTAKTPYDHFTFRTATHSFEVIGNIHENENLLTEM